MWVSFKKLKAAKFFVVLKFLVQVNNKFYFKVSNQDQFFAKNLFQTVEKRQFNPLISYSSYDFLSNFNKTKNSPWLLAQRFRDAKKPTLTV